MKLRIGVISASLLPMARFRAVWACTVWSSQDGCYYYRHFECDTVRSGSLLRMFQRYLLPLIPVRWEHQVPPKRRWRTNILHTVTSNKKLIWFWRYFGPATHSITINLILYSKSSNRFQTRRSKHRQIGIKFKDHIPFYDRLMPNNWRVKPCTNIFITPIRGSWVQFIRCWNRYKARQIYEYLSWCNNCINNNLVHWKCCNILTYKHKYNGK